MNSQIKAVAKLVGAIPLVCLTIACGFGFLASSEPGFGAFPNIFHALYGAVGLAAVIGTISLALPATN